MSNVKMVKGEEVNNIFQNLLEFIEIQNKGYRPNDDSNRIVIVKDLEKISGQVGKYVKQLQDGCDHDTSKIKNWKISNHPTASYLFQARCTNCDYICIKYRGKTCSKCFKEMKLEGRGFHGEEYYYCQKCRNFYEDR